MAFTAPRPRAQRTGPPLTSALLRRQVVARPLGDLVQGGHEGPFSSIGADAGRFRALWDELRPHLDGLYLSFETDQRPQRLHDSFPGQTLTRLRELKAVYDPENVFNQNFPLPT